MHLHDALDQIAEIRSHIARTETFRGYRSVTVTFTGVLAIVAGALQGLIVPRPAVDIEAYLVLWIAAAVLGVCATGVEMTVRCRRARSAWATRLTWLAVEQFVPCLLAGGAVTAVLYLSARENLWMLPGLWSVVFSLGVFASCRLLPRATFWIAGWYLLAGVLCLALARGEHAFSPWAMVLPFGLGQFATAAVLYLTLERHDGSLETTFRE